MILEHTFNTCDSFMNHKWIKTNPIRNARVGSVDRFYCMIPSPIFWLLNYFDAYTAPFQNMPLRCINRSKVTGGNPLELLLQRIFSFISAGALQATHEKQHLFCVSLHSMAASAAASGLRLQPLEFSQMWLMILPVTIKARERIVSSGISS